MPRAYDFWDSVDQEHFNPDGTMQEPYRQLLMDSGVSLEETWGMEARKMAEVKEFGEREERYLQLYGEAWSEITKRRSQQLTSEEKQARQLAVLQEGAQISELPYDMEPDEYYDYHAGYPG